jgi:hypothetical protein
MRALRKIVGFLVASIGLLVLVAGAIFAFGVVGSDNTLTMKDQSLSSAGVAVVTAPELLGVTNATLRVDVRAADPAKPVFVGIAHAEDATSYLADRSFTGVQTYTPPASLTMVERAGVSAPLSAPTGMDWWVAKSTGKAGANLTWAMTNDKVVLVVMNADGSPALKTTADIGLQVKGAFSTSLLGAAAGLLLLVLGGGMLFGRRKKTGDIDFASIPGPDLPSQAISTPSTASTTSDQEMAR